MEYLFVLIGIAYLLAPIVAFVFALGARNRDLRDRDMHPGDADRNFVRVVRSLRRQRLYDRLERDQRHYRIDVE